MLVWQHRRKKVTGYDMPQENTLLLPAGFHSILPPDGNVCESIRSALFDLYQKHGYDVIIPTLMEFEESLFSGEGKILRKNSFRAIDPDTQKVMAIRSDITLQVSRLATTRLANTPRPLRLSYAGIVLNVESTNVYKERQRLQSGVELLGATSTTADIEVIHLALSALALLGIKNITLDLTLPRLSDMIIAEIPKLPLSEGEALKRAIAAKDLKVIDQLAKEQAPLLAKLTDANITLEDLQNLPLPERASQLIDDLTEIIQKIRKLHKNIDITIDPLEYGKFGYHTGIGFSLFCQQSQNELGRGGRYKINDEAAVGFSLFINELLRVIPASKQQPYKRIFVPVDTSKKDLEELHSKGYATIHALETMDKSTLKATAKNHNCDAFWWDKKVDKV